MIPSLGLLDTVLAAAFLYLVPRRSRWAVWIARYFTLRLGWFTIGLLAGFKAVQYYRRNNLNKWCTSIGVWFAVLTIVSTLQFLLLRLGDRAVIGLHCGTYDPVRSQVDGMVQREMDTVVRGMVPYLSPMSRQLNATYCNVELVRRSLYSATTISSMDDNILGRNTLRLTDGLRKSMKNRCSVTIEKITSKDMADAKGRHLTHLVHHITDAQWAYVQPKGPLRTSRDVGLVSMKLFHALNLLPEAPGFWDDARKLPPLTSTDIDASFGSKINHIYQGYFRSLSTSLHGGFPIQTIHGLYHRRRCACNDWDSYDHTSAAENPSDCDVQTQLDDYMKRYLAPSSVSLPIDLAPMDKIVEMRDHQPPCNASRAALNHFQNPEQKRTFKQWQANNCAAIGPLNSLPHFDRQKWSDWWDHLGVSRPGMR
ncbi:hypothetical protein AC578_7042 [Pseudocercospora eumusae]|uniref:Uncharacterized protein n=1 Tax=Pseudocercospora eumusae TaxID=321146 RepID=A0A139GVU0_9PEZI|nr:hypothetical protein AC578_7042 [Pseudocercospora eumusae]